MAKINEAHVLVIESLTEALIRLMRQKPLREISISELCEKAGVSRVSFYRNYSSMEDILLKHMISCTDEWWEHFSQKNADAFYRDFWPSLLEQYQRNDELIRLIYDNGVSHILMDHIYTCVSREADGSERDAYVRSALAGTLFGLVNEWIRRGMGEFPADFHLVDLLRTLQERGVAK